MFKISAAFFLLSTCLASAAECHSVGGHINGAPATSIRTAKVQGARLDLSGVMDGNAMPKRTLSCLSLAEGVWCESAFGPVSVIVMTNGKLMTETVLDSKTGKEVAAFSYVCNRAP